MCEELRKLNKFDSIIPQPLLNVYDYKPLIFCIIYNYINNKNVYIITEKGQPMPL